MAISLAKMCEDLGVKPDPNGTTRAKTPVFRSSYANIFKARENQSGVKKFSMAMIFKKADKAKLKPVVQAIANAAAKKFGADMTKWKRTYKNPLRDGDEDRDGKEFENAFFITGSSGEDRKPGVVNRQLDEIGPDDFWSGDYARATLNFYAYDKAGNVGVGCGLANVLLWEKGERLDGSVAAEDDFKEFAEEATVEEGDDDGF